MKKLFLLLFFMFSIFFSQAQIVDVPDPNFKAALIANGIDTSNDGEIQVSEAEDVVNINVSSANISSLEGIQSFVNLEILNCDSNILTELDLSQNPLLTILYCSYNQLANIDISQNLELIEFYASYNQLPESILTQNSNVRHVGLEGNQLDGIDLSQSTSLETIDLDSNNLLEIDLSATRGQALSYMNNPVVYINLKNGYETYSMEGTGVTTLQYICIDDTFYEINFFMNYTDILINSYCSFTPGGEFYIIEGQNTLEFDINGCDVNDNGYPFLKFNITNGSVDGSLVSNSSGLYNIPVQEGNHILTPAFENPDYFNISPPSLSVDFPTDSSPFVQDFCITPNGVRNDLEIIILSFSEPVPGFDGTYGILYKNKGNTVLSGTVEFDFNEDADYISLLYADPLEDNLSSNVLSWNFTDLEPFETREIYVSFNMNTPTDVNFPLNADDELDFTASILPNDSDETPEDNTFDLKQIVVNSFDPNDITCLEGARISPEDVGEFVHYMVRFENTGSADAINIVVSDDIDENKYDITSLLPLHGSHDFITRINGNKTEFIFENINLPFDDANNYGYLVFKIKTLQTLILGDVFENTAQIYFDFNEPIITNTYVTLVVDDNLSIGEFDQSKTKIYPNPVKDIVFIKNSNGISSLSVTDIHGRIVMQYLSKGFETERHLNLSPFESGIYFVNVHSQEKSEIIKIVKN
ncbi:hypothetical protein A9Q87_07610 [Flavobacteriales bacterium 34_180_T64]|nr:hypothetical protein A9Q87_07610 [Flavobacteriales bacterium 34_180_T64]